MEILIMLIYLALMFAIGFYFKERVTTSEHFFLSNRDLPAWVLSLTFAATFIGAAATMGRSGLAYDVGFPAIGLALASVFGLYMFTFFSDKINKIGRENNISTISNLMTRRFGKTAGIISALIILFSLLGTTGGQMIASTSILKLITEPWGVSYELAAIIQVTIVVLYTFMSGMYGVAYTDAVQAGILFISLAIILPIVLIKGAGGWGHITATLPASYFSFNPGSTILSWMYVYVLYFSAGPPYWHRAFAGRSPKETRGGIFAGTTMILIYTVMIVIVGIAAKVFWPEMPQGVHHENVIPLLVRQFFPPLFSSVVMAAIMAVLMSTIDSYLLNISQIFINDVVNVIRKEPLSEDQSIKFSKISVIVFGFAALFFTFTATGIINAMVSAFGFYASSLALPALASLYWKKATKEGVIAGMLTGMIVGYAWDKVLLKPFGLHPSIPGGILCLVALVVVSLSTFKEKKVVFFE